MATLTVTVTIDDTEQATMLNDLTDINQWQDRRPLRSRLAQNPDPGQSH